MEGIDTERKVLHISESVCLPFKQFDFVVEAFDHSGGEGMIEEVQDTGTMSGHGTGEFYDLDNPAGPGFLEPVFRIHFRLGAAGTGPECA